MDGRILVGWKRAFTGPDVAFVAPTGAKVGVVRIHQRLAPILPIRRIVEPLIAKLTGAQLEGPETLVTAEGEHAAVMNARAGDLQRTIAVIYGDEHYAVIEGHSADAGQHALVRAAVTRLAYTHLLGLGTDRWRRFYYDPPPGWSALPRPFATLWFAPSCPRAWQTITVFDARPPRGGRPTQVRQHIFESLPAEFGQIPHTEPVYESTREGLPVQYVGYTGSPSHRPGPVTVINAVVRDQRYLYPFRLEYDSVLGVEPESAFRALVVSMRPVPARAPETHVISSDWAE